MRPSFPGFPREAIEFFAQLEKHNTREWFQPRKEHFEQFVKTPMEALIAAVNTGMARFAPQHVTDPKKALFRIYRDTRFSHDKTPYKDHIAASFGRRGMEKLSAGGFYFAVNHKHIEVAGGVYHPDRSVLLTLRGHIAATYEDFQELLANRKLRKLVGELQGAELSRIPKGFEPGHPGAALLRKKDWILFTNLNPELACSPKLLSEILTRFEAMAPVVEYLNAPLRSKQAQARKFNL